jgi:hypothetical protein
MVQVVEVIAVGAGAAPGAVGEPPLQAADSTVAIPARKAQRGNVMAGVSSAAKV